MYDLRDEIRVYRDPERGEYALVLFSTIIDFRESLAEQERRATQLREIVGRRLTQAYYQFSVELRDRLRWQTGAGAEETMKQVERMKVDLDESHADILQLREQIEALESERCSFVDLLRERDRKFQDTDKKFKEALEVASSYAGILKTIQDSTSDAESRRMAMEVLYREGQ